MSFGLEIANKADIGLVRFLESIGSSVARKVVRQAVSAATTPVLKAAKKKVPTETKLLKKSLGKRLKTYRKNGVVVAVVGPRTGFGKEVTLPNGKTMFRDPVKYAHLIERGHRIAAGGQLTRVGKLPKPSDTGSVAGHVPARPFLRPAFDENKSKMISIMRRKFADGVIREAKKLSGK